MAFLYRSMAVFSMALLCGAKDACSAWDLPRTKASAWATYTFPCWNGKYGLVGYSSSAFAYESTAQATASLVKPIKFWHTYPLVDQLATFLGLMLMAPLAALTESEMKLATLALSSAVGAVLPTPVILSRNTPMENMASCRKYKSTFLLLEAAILMCEIASSFL